MLPSSADNREQQAFIDLPGTDRNDILVLRVRQFGADNIVR